MIRMVLKWLQKHEEKNTIGLGKPSTSADMSNPMYKRLKTDIMSSLSTNQYIDSKCQSVHYLTLPRLPDITP